MDKTCDFSYGHYLETVKKFNRKDLILRHDVDISLEKAYNFAFMEFNSGIESTYFILPHGRFYNPFTSVNISRIKNMEKMGHRIGLHLDRTMLNDNDEIALRQILSLRNYMIGMLHIPINFYAYHNVARGKTGSEDMRKSLDPLMREFNFHYPDHKYISDSSMRWREGCFCNHIGKKMLVLTHPIWWNKFHRPYKDVLHDWYIHVMNKHQKVYREYEHVLDHTHENITCT